MKLIKKWLLPVLTCLIAAGAAVLPPYLSQLRDAGQFGQVHAEALAADALPVRNPSTLLERLALYARWCTPSETTPSFQRSETDHELSYAIVRDALVCLAEANIIPIDMIPHLSEESLEVDNMDYIMLWDPLDSIGRQTPVGLWKAMGSLGERSFWIDLDAETGLPLALSIYDPNMAQWFPYKEPDTLPGLAQRYFDLLGLEAEPVGTNIPASDAPWSRLYSVDGISLNYYFSFNATILTIGLDIAGSGSNAFSG